MAESDLFDQDGEGLGSFADAGEADAKHRPEGSRRPGRPKGALNRKTEEFDKWYQAKGFKDPLVALAQFLTSDPVALQSWFIEHERTHKALGKGTAKAVPSLIEIIKEMHAVASQLAPYLHGKKPTQLEIIDERLPSLIIDLGTNQHEQGQMIAGRKAMSIGINPAGPVPDDATNENNDLDEDDG